MADDLKADLLDILAKHGAAGLEARNLPIRTVPGNLAASYIREIITGDQVFDERILERVSNILSNVRR